MATTPRPLADYFAELRDPRVQLKCAHNFMDIILIVVCATIGGADDFVSAAAFAEAKEDWFRDRLGLTLGNGIPSHDTLNRVFAIIHPTQFQKCFLGWVESMSDRLKLKQIPIDGKAIRGSKRKTSAGARTVQIVSAWSSENGVTLAQVRTDEKSNEITAIPELLRLLDISKALVSIDAAGCQKTIATQIVEGGGDYLLAVKENQPRLLEDIKVLVRGALETDFAGLSRHQTDEYSHGREELRFCVALTNLDAIRDRALWTGLKSVVCVVSRRKVKGKKESREVRYYISSRRGSGKMFLGASRRHWSIENECHWILDVAFREDDHRLREGHAPENMSVVRKMALAMLKKATAKIGIKNKRLKAGWDETFLEHVLRDSLGK
jgi:predicted transposase YbfD/YdcC